MLKIIRLIPGYYTLLTRAFILGTLPQTQMHVTFSLSWGDLVAYPEVIGELAELLQEILRCGRSG